MTQVLWSESHRKNSLHVRQWKQPMSCRFILSCWNQLNHVHLSLQVSRTCFNNEPNQTCSPQFRGELYMFKFFRSDMFSPVGLSCACRHCMTASVKRVKRFRGAILSCHFFFPMFACISKLCNHGQTFDTFHFYYSFVDLL